MHPLAANKLYADFSDYSEGPLGTNLLRLLYGIIDRPLPTEAVHFGAVFDEEVENAVAAIEAARNVGNAQRLMDLAKTESIAWETTPVLRCHAVESLIKLGRNDEALQAIASLEGEFPRANRVKQLKGLALARKGELEAAQLVLGELEAAGHRDPETLGIYARTWMDRYLKTGQKNFLRTSRNYYELAFQHTPSDYYVGINAASKSLLLDETEKAAELAKEVEKLVGADPIAGNYWKTATVAEAQLLQRKYEQAAFLYAAARSMAPLDYGSLCSTRDQARLLMDHLQSPPAERARIEAVFEDVCES
jgi:tetratricopeptide (TPR) repeat protein